MRVCPSRGGSSHSGIGRQPLVPRVDTCVDPAAEAREQPQQGRQDRGRERSPRQADGDRPDAELLSGAGDDLDQPIPYLLGRTPRRGRPAACASSSVMTPRTRSSYTSSLKVSLCLTSDACGIEAGVANELIEALGRKSRALGGSEAAHAAIDPDDLLPAVDDRHAALGGRLRRRGAALRESANREDAPQEHEARRGDGRGDAGAQADL